MNNTFDVMVLGLGAAGSSALYHLSKTGKRVCGIDQFEPPHAQGSSHGQSRITRQAYHEDPLYVPFIKKAYELWDEVEKNSGKQLFLKTGGLMLGSPDAGVIKGAELSARTHDIPYEYLSNHEISKRFPALKPNKDTVGVLEKNAGILFPEECVKVHLELATANGAKIHTSEKVLAVTAGTDMVEVVTGNATYSANKAIISTGAWISEFLPDLNLPLSVERQVLYWFKTNNVHQADIFAPQNLPVYIWEYAPKKMFYGFPDLGDGIKVAHHHVGEPTTPHTLNRNISDEEVEAMQDVVKEYFNLKPEFNYGAVCMYTNTPDERFVIDYHPAHKNIIIASPCTGHGFKFASITGKLLSQLALDSKPELNIDIFSVNRFL
ncbi:N-methyl-L-tryptophan oxidase [Mucilaginibacter limnophilus]|uniref:N-methyl-L-tryptophan oxidase n=1 Tax=Mucilaginibacter limnophilus TaxID=1932778 RepID=A0A3S2X162_9SPHI|nr:N-methyl-L-tryptophan oxidase [Mucilaginibacter limnophilus]RVU03040.1 N-methyl-L-tryptophan oxidase [Mucilaginibacter limnophilus]